MIESLQKQLPPEQILTDDESLETYAKDWTKPYQPKASAVVFPKSTEDVQKVVKWANETKTALIPSGGRTGLSGGAFATKGEVIISFEKMNKVLDFNPFDQTVRCEAGVITENLQQFAEEKGLYYPVDFAARGSSQIGGNIATNAGGIKVVRYGLTRDWVASLTVVTGAGDILKLNQGLVKNATGYDLRHLFIGSEGTLGFITECEIKLASPPPPLHLFVFGVEDLAAVMNLFHQFRSQFKVQAFEMFTELALGYVLKHTDLQRPFETETPYYVLIEIENENDETLDAALGLLESGMESGAILDGTLSQTKEQSVQLWRLREDISEATSHYSPYKNDVSVRISEVPGFLTEMDQILKEDYPEFDVVWFGHIGDGNLHINILKPEGWNSDDFIKACHKVDDRLFGMIQAKGGSVSAEHGVGLVKKPYLHLTRSQTEIELMRQVRKVFDPNGIINPGKVFDA